MFAIKNGTRMEKTAPRTVRVWPALDPTAAKLTLGIWASTFLLFLAPQFAATGRIAPFSVGVVGIEIAVGLLLSLPLYAAANAVKDKSNWIKIAIVVPMVCVVALAFSLFDALAGGIILKLFMVGHRVPEDVVGLTVSNFISFSWLYGMLGSIYVILQTNAVMRERERQLAEARMLAQTAQLTALRLQLNPHFLFNTLNAISSLVVTGKNKQGEAMLSKLCAFLRAALTTDLKEGTSIGEELETLQNYLEIEAIRFGGRLTIEFDCPEELLDHPVPNFILQPLVENAIKHGVAPTSRPVIIRVSARRTETHVVLRVEDNGKGRAEGPAPQGMAVGLKNVQRRLDVIYGGKAGLETMAHADGFLAVIRLPAKSRPVLELVG